MDVLSGDRSALRMRASDNKRRQSMKVERKEKLGRTRDAMQRAGRAMAPVLPLTMVLAVPCGSAIAQDNYPRRPVKIIAPQAPGGGVDLVARIIADRLRVAMGQSFVIENQAGAGGAIATQMTARAQPDGYT